VNYPKRAAQPFRWPEGTARVGAAAGLAMGPRTVDAMAAIRERLSEALLRFGTEAAMDRVLLQRSLASAHGARGSQEALGAMEVARWVDAAALWMGWRLRPRHMIAPR
jgi:hypothetical protein